MRENYWVNAFTNTELSVHSPAGSPRAWLLKAIGSPGGDLYIQHGSMHPKSIAIAGLWVREGARLPDTGMNKTLYRFFDLPENLNARPHQKYNKKVAYIGMCVSVPVDEILTWMRAFKQSGCKWLWWATPEAEPSNEFVKLNHYKRLDHSEIYRRFEAGAIPNALARELGIQVNTMRYIYNKWVSGQQPGLSVGPLTEETIDAIRGDLVDGELTMQEIANRYKTTRATVSKWAKRFGLGKGTRNVKTKAANSS